MRWLRLVKSFVGWVLASVGLLGLALTVDKTLAGTEDAPLFGVSLGLVFLGAGLSMVWSVRKAARLEAEEIKRIEGLTPDTWILRAAVHRGGRITAAEAAADTPLSFEDAQSVLDLLSRAGACRVMVGENSGVVVYHFPEFETQDAKKMLM